MFSIRRLSWMRGVSVLAVLLVAQGSVERVPAQVGQSSWFGFRVVVARAQADDTEDPLVVARGKFQRGIELKNAGDYGGALALFREVGQVKMTPQVRYHIASCEESLGRLVAAYGGYDLALKQGQGMPQDFIVEVEQALSRLNERIPKLILKRGAGAEAATFELDGVVLGASSVGQEIPIDPGPHSVSASAPGHKAFSMTVQAEESKVETIEVVLKPDEKRVDVRPPPPPPPPPQGFGLAPFIVGGSGLAVAVVGVVLLPVSQANIGEARQLCLGSTDCSQPGIGDDQRAQAKQIVDSARTVETVGWALMGVGLVATGVGAALYVLDPARKAEKDRAGEQALEPGVRIQVGARNTDLGMTLLGVW